MALNGLAILWLMGFLPGLAVGAVVTAIFTSLFAKRVPLFADRIVARLDSINLQNEDIRKAITQLTKRRR